MRQARRNAGPLGERACSSRCRDEKPASNGFAGGSSPDEPLSHLAEWSERNRLGIEHARARFDLEMSKEKKLRAVVEGLFTPSSSQYDPTPLV
jgi:hypothetical protein